MRFVLIFSLAVFLSVANLFGTLALLGQENFAKGDPLRWANDIERFEALDRRTRRAHTDILFVGSSTIRLWNTDKWFPDAGVINRGFGGSQTSDTLYYFDRIVARYKPSRDD